MEQDSWGWGEAPVDILNCRRPGGTYRSGFPRRRPLVAQDRWLLRLAEPA